MPRSIFAPRIRSRRPGPLAAGLLLLLALAGAPPAHAGFNATTPIIVRDGGTLTIAAGDSVDTSGNDAFSAIMVNSGGTLIMTGGSVKSAYNHAAILVDGGT